MIRESIVITTDLKNKPHVVPMGITFNKSKLVISPYIPSKTYLNLKENPYAVINFTDDVNIFVDALLGKKNFEIKPTKKIKNEYTKMKTFLKPRNYASRLDFEKSGFFVHWLKNWNKTTC